MSSVGHRDKDNVSRGAGVGLVGLSFVLFFLALASASLIPGLNATWVWVVSGGLTAGSSGLALRIFRTNG